MIYDVLFMQGLVFLHFCRSRCPSFYVDSKNQDKNAGSFCSSHAVFLLVFVFIGAQTDAAHDLSLNAKTRTVCIFNCCKTFVFILVNVQSDV